MDNYAKFLQEQAAVNQMYAEMRAPQPITPYQSPNVTVISGETKSMVSPDGAYICLLYTSPSPRDLSTSRMPSSA